MAPKTKSSQSLSKLFKNHPEKMIALWVTAIALVVVLALIGSQGNLSQLFNYGKSQAVSGMPVSNPATNASVGQPGAKACSANNQTSTFTPLNCPYNIVATGGTVSNFTITKDTLLQGKPNEIHKYDISCSFTCNCAAVAVQVSPSCPTINAGTLVTAITTGCTPGSTFNIANQSISTSITLTGAYDNAFKSPKAQQACTNQVQTSCGNNSIGNKTCSGSSAATNVKPSTATLICSYCKK